MMIRLLCFVLILALANAAAVLPAGIKNHTLATKMHGYHVCPQDFSKFESPLKCLCYWSPDCGGCFSNYPFMTGICGYSGARLCDLEEYAMLGPEQLGDYENGYYFYNYFNKRIPTSYQDNLIMTVLMIDGEIVTDFGSWIECVNPRRREQLEASLKRIPPQNKTPRHPLSPAKQAAKEKEEVEKGDGDGCLAFTDMEDYVVCCRDAGYVNPPPDCPDGWYPHPGTDRTPAFCAAPADAEDPMYLVDGINECATHGATVCDLWQTALMFTPVVVRDAPGYDAFDTYGTFLMDTPAFGELYEGWFYWDFEGTLLNGDLNFEGLVYCCLDPAGNSKWGNGK